MASNKCTEKLCCNVPEWLSDEFVARARAAHCTPSELLRDLVAVNLIGKTWGEHVTQDRRAALGLEAPEQTLLRACK